MHSTGIIFDFQRSAMYDGPGIRTVIFLKGCPLSCRWCHNPESQSITPQLAFFREKCVGCGKCAQVCPHYAHEIKDGAHLFNPALCKACGVCVPVCPAGALRLYGKQVDVETLISMVKKDRPYYEASGGGLTVSGGEPFFQFFFTKALLKAAKKEGIHTCIETSGFTSRGNLMESLSFTNLYLFDYKMSDDQQHLAYTGVSNRIPLQNLDLLYQNHARIILRCPVIPGINDNAEHFRAIRDLEKQYPDLKGIEILPYHDYGKSKETALCRTPAVTCATVTQEQRQFWKKSMQEIGCSERIIQSF